MYLYKSESDSSGGLPSASSISEGVSIQLVPAPFFKRLLAYCVDLGILGTISYALLIVGGIVGAIVWASLAKVLPPEVAIIVGIAMLIFVLLCLLTLAEVFFIYQESKTGTTPGKRIFGLRVVSLDGTRLTRGQCTIRAFARWVDCYMVLPGVVAIVATTRKQRIGDLMAGTMVVHSARLEKAQHNLYLDGVRYHHLRDVLAPQPFPLPECKELLAAVFRPLTLPGGSITVMTREALIDKFRPFLDSTGIVTVESNELLRFIAEEAFQCVHAKGGK